MHFPFFDYNDIVGRSHIGLGVDGGIASLSEVRHVLGGQCKVKTLHFCLHKCCKRKAVPVYETVGVLVALNVCISVYISR